MGLVTVISVKAEIGTVERFHESGRLSSYAGLAPRVMQSGEHRKIGQIVRVSNKHLRSAMFIAAQSCARFGPLKLQDFHRRIREKQGFKVATVALARKLLVMVWKMLKEKKPFEMAYNDGLAQRKQHRMRKNLRRLKKLGAKYGDENVFEAIREVLLRQQRETFLTESAI